MAVCANGVARLDQAVELAPFFKQWGLWRVQIFRLPIAHHPAAEADHRAARAEDREHHALAEAVVALALFAFDHQAGLDERLVLVRRKRGLQALPSVRRVADTETSRDFSRQTAPLEVIDGARRFFELRAIELHRVFHQGVEIGLALLARRLLRRGGARFGHLHAHRGGELLYRVDITERRIRHQETDGVAVHAAAEAVIELLRRAHAEGRCLFVMERAEAEVVGAALLELDVARDHVHDVHPIEQVLLERLGDHAPILTQPASFVFTSAETLPMSALPARRGLSSAITLPMSLTPLAPDSAIAALTAWAISASPIWAGR